MLTQQHNKDKSYPTSLKDEADTNVSTQGLNKLKKVLFCLIKSDNDGARRVSLGKTFHRWGATTKKIDSLGPSIEAHREGPLMKIVGSLTF